MVSTKSSFRRRVAAQSCHELEEFITRRFILAATIGFAIPCAFATQCLATVMTFTGIVSQVNVTSNLGNFTVGDPVSGSVTFDPPPAYFVNVGSR